MNIVFAFIAEILLVVYEALVVMKIWDWHVVPAFNVHHIIFTHCLGLCVLISLFKFRAYSESEIEDRNISSVVFQSAFQLTMYLLLAWTFS